MLNDLAYKLESERSTLNELSSNIEGTRSLMLKLKGLLPEEIATKKKIKNIIFNLEFNLKGHENYLNSIEREIDMVKNEFESYASSQDNLLSSSDKNRLYGLYNDKFKPLFDSIKQITENLAMLLDGKI